MASDRPQTPADVKRVLRQDACFGCCACGNPLLQYHHIIPYAEDHHFRPADMMALCPNHHVEANERVLDEQQQRALKTSPFNCNQGLASGQLALRQLNTDVDLGGHIFVADAGQLIRVDGDPLLTTRVSSAGGLLLSVRLFHQEDQLVAEVVDNEWISYDPFPWDIEFRFRELKIRCGPRKISLAIGRSPSPSEVNSGERADCCGSTPQDYTLMRHTLSPEGVSRAV
jgi:predicted  nucleic acid-binding Zn-ribbon protein